MRFFVPQDLPAFGGHVAHLLELADKRKWLARADELDREKSISPYRWKIVSDYHWLEMAIAHQYDVLSKAGQLLEAHADTLTRAAVNFAGTVVEVHRRLSPQGQKQLEGRLRDALNATTGFAALYLEMDLAQRLIDQGCDVEFPDLEGRANYDLAFTHEDFIGEVECKSLSADAGRQIHRKDFYRFVDALRPAMERRSAEAPGDLVLITLPGRLSSAQDKQAILVRAAQELLVGKTPAHRSDQLFRLEKYSVEEVLGTSVHTSEEVQSLCAARFGPNLHIAGELTAPGAGCLVVMRSEKEDDTSAPQLEAMRKAATQFSGKRPAFIAMQCHGVELADLMLPHWRRRVGILSYALYGHYSADHVNATYITGFGAVLMDKGHVGTPAFAIPNPRPRYPATASQASTFLGSISDQEFADAIGLPLPAPNISQLVF